MSALFSLRTVVKYGHEPRSDLVLAEGVHCGKGESDFQQLYGWLDSWKRRGVQNAQSHPSLPPFRHLLSAVAWQGGVGGGLGQKNRVESLVFRTLAQFSNFLILGSQGDFASKASSF